MHADLYRALADLVLVTHVAFVAFVVFGLILILCGGVRGWGWVRNPWFRAAHLAAIGLVVFQAWFGIVCPLTILERFLREAAGEVTYDETFIAHWLHRVLFFQAPMWAFTVCYTLFGLAVVVSWIWFRPRGFRVR
jgi:Protein of Unknown function (DUF2784)